MATPAAFSAAAASALPAVRTLPDCADFTRTVLPYLPQLRALPSQLVAGYSAPDINVDALKAFYLATNPAIMAVAISIALAPVFLVVSEINRNYSQVDRVWSLLPTLYNAHYALYAHMAGLPTQRVDTLLAFSSVWSARLTFNYWRRGGYSIGSEDYRWEILREKIPSALFFVFNVTFISLFQSLLLCAVSLPTYILLLTTLVSGQEHGTADIVFSRVLVGLVLVEWFADQQQWTYQQTKKKYKETAQVPAGYTADDLERGFVVTGLWAWSRHPNFAAEQTIWALVYQYSCFVTDTYFNWTGFGAMSYLILFQGSTWVTESISAGKYPEYAEYQERVGRFLPKWSTATKAEDEAEVRKEIEKRSKGKGKGKGKGKAE